MSLSFGKLKLPSLQEVQAVRAARSFGYYVDFLNGFRYVSGKHLEELDAVLQRVSDGELKRVIVTMPPRHGKSERVSKTFPAWHLGRHPNDEIIVSSYSVDLSRGFSRLARQAIVDSKDVFPGVELDPNNSGAESWGIQGTRGGLHAAGVGGPITGKGARIAIIDDPLKNAEEANSQTMRDKVWEWYQSTLYTRLTPDGAIIVVMTRWHEDDLVGRLLAKEAAEIKDGSHVGERWTVIDYPALAEQNDRLGRAVGEALWPQRGFDEAWAKVTKSNVGSYVWNALYQQRPSAAEGAMLKREWWKYYDFDPRLKQWDEMAQSWDCTFKDSDGSDYVVGQVWGRIGANKYLLDQWRARADIGATMQAIINMTAKWPKARAKYIEDKANGPAIIQLLKARIGGIIAVNPEGGKIARVSAVAPEIEAGNVYLPSGKPWVEDFIEEAAAFPRGANDDQVDAMSQAINKMQYRWVDEPGEQPASGGFYGPNELEDLGLTKKNELRRIR